MTAGSRPANSQPAAIATSGVPTTIDREMADRKRRQVAQPTRRERDVRTRDAEDRAEHGKRARGDRADAATSRSMSRPVAVSVRSSPADSLRMRPTVIARMTSASSIPAAIAPNPMFASRAWLSRLSISTPYCVAMTRAAFELARRQRRRRLDQPLTRRRRAPARVPRAAPG